VGENATTGTAVDDQWDGTSWSIMTPVATNYQPSLFDVSCTSPTFCVAVGFYTDISGFHLNRLAEQWNGSVWAQAPNP
jgi:hypothetical protein